MNRALRAASGHRVEPEPERQPEADKPGGFEGGVGMGEDDLLNPPQDVNSQIRAQVAALRSRVDTDEVLPRANRRTTTGDTP